MIRNATTADAPAIAKLYDYYVRHTTITFDVDLVPAEDIARRIGAVLDADLPWLVWDEDSTVIGFAYAAPYRPRAAYSQTVEVSIYLGQGELGRGIGRSLYEELLRRLRELPLHLALSLIALPNDASVALHERLGFTHAGTFNEVGRKFDQWVDVGHWQLSLDA